MKLTLALLFVVFWIILISDCFFILNMENEYRFYTKPLLMSVLFAIMSIETTDTSHKRSKLIVTLILLFSLGGDLLLLNDGDKSYLTLGLICFFMVHVFYTIFFFKIKHFSTKRLGIILIGLVVIVTYLFSLLHFIWPKIADNDLSAQIIVYSVSIGLMFLGAVNTIAGKRAKKVGVQNFIPGAILFVISDSILGISKFYYFINPPKMLFPVLNCAVMLTYGAAQVLLIIGAIKFIKK